MDQKPYSDKNVSKTDLLSVIKIYISMDELSVLRQEIDTLDQEIIRLLAERFKRVTRVAEYKKRHNIAPLQSDRWKEVMNRLMVEAANHELDPACISEIWECIHTYALQRENAIITE